MKKIFGVMTISMMFFPSVFVVSAASPCEGMPFETIANWNSLNAESQQLLSNEYCGTGGTSLDNIQVSPSGTASDNIQVGSSGLSASTKLKNPIKYDNFSQFVSAVTKTAVQVLMPFIVLAFIYSGFLFVSAQGNTDKLEKAKTAITYSMIGAFILLGAWGFAQIIGQTISTLTQ